MKEEWWLDTSALPDLYWARLRFADDGTARVLDLDGRTYRFDSVASAEAWLREDEYATLADLIEDKKISPATLPPSAVSDAEILP